MPAPYPFGPILAADPSNTENVAKGGTILIYAPGDPSKTPLALTDLSFGMAVPNPLPVNANGFGPAFLADLDQVAWEGGGFTGTFESYGAMRDDTEAARLAAEEAQAAAEAAAASAVAPTDEAVNAVLSDPESTASGTVAAAISASVTAATAPVALDAPMAANVDNVSSTWWTVLLAKLKSLFVGKGELYFNIRDYGAVGNGVADDTAAVQAAVNAAALVEGTVLVPAGKYFIGSSTTFANPSGEGTFPRYAIAIPNGVSILARKGAIFTERIDYNNRRVMIYIKGSDVNITGLTIRNDYDQAGGSRPTSIPIGAGDAFDPDLAQDIENVTIRDCTFLRSWYNTKFSFHQTGGTRKARNIRIIDCRGTHETVPPTTGGLSSGGYNFRSNMPSRISDVQVRGCADDNSSVSAAIGIYGVQNFVVTGNILNGSQIDGAGIQTENGSDHGVIANNVLTNHYNHIWVDDSTNIVIENNVMRNTTANSSFKGVRVTKQGYAEVPSPTVTGIAILGNNLRNCNITIENFGTPVGVPIFGDIDVSHNRVALDGIAVSYGISVPGMVGTRVVTNAITGAVVSSIYISPITNQAVIVMGNITTKLGSEASVGLTIANTSAFRPIVVDNQFINGAPSAPYPVSGTIGAIRIYTSTGDPNGTASGPVGSIYLRADGGAGTSLYVKETGTGNTGWVAK